MEKIIKGLEDTYNQIDWTKSFSMINTVTFLSYSIDEYTFTKEYSLFLKPHEKRTLHYSSALLAIAGAYYSVLDVNRPTLESELVIRYGDWLFTTPLLLIVLASYYRLSIEKIYNLVALNVLMIVFGFLHESTDNIFYWYIGSLSYLGIVYLLWQYLDEKDLFYRYFLFGWSLYGLLTFLPLEKKLFYFTILDFYNKLMFAMEIRNKIVTDVNERKDNLKGIVKI